MPPNTSTSPVIFRVSKDDRITYVNEQWDVFALQNSGEGITSDKVLGQPLWQFISDRTTRKLYQQALARIRSGRSLQFSLRCDSPSFGRLLQMDITQVGTNGEVEFRTVTLEETPRNLPPAAATADESGKAAMIRACGWCNRFDVNGEWLEIEDALPKLRLLEYPKLPMLSHGICEECFKRMSELMGQPA